MLGQSKFVSVDDFKNYWGLDLRNLVRSDDNESNQAERFLARVEDRLMNWIDNNTFRRLRYEDLKNHPKQYENWQKAILTQAMYMFKNGDLGLDSGYDAEKGIVVARHDLIELEVCQSAIDYLSNAGLFNLVVKNRPRYGKLLYGFGEFGGPDAPVAPQMPIPVSDLVIYDIRGAIFNTLINNHFYETQFELNLPSDFFAKDEYMVNIKINNDIRQMRFMNNRVDQEKYGMLLYDYNNVTYEFVVYVNRSGPTIRIRCATVIEEP